MIDYVTLEDVIVALNTRERDYLVTHMEYCCDQNIPAQCEISWCSHHSSKKPREWQEHTCFWELGVGFDKQKEETRDFIIELIENQVIGQK